MPWQFAEYTSIGGRSEQQDRIRVFSAADNTHLAVVADGMGGHESGGAAAQAMIDIAGQYFSCPEISDPREFLEQVCVAAHERIRTSFKTGQPSPGCTCVMLLVDGPEAYWIHVGDTRLYHYRDGKLLGGTRDHSIVQQMLDEGRIGEAEARNHPLQNQIYMRLGGEQLPEPDFDCLALESEEVFLLCTDGLWEFVDTEEMASLLFSEDSRHKTARELVNRAKERGGSEADNISLILADWTAHEKIDESACPGNGAHRFSGLGAVFRRITSRIFPERE